MAVIYTERQIAELIAQPKVLSIPLNDALQLRNGRSSNQRDVDVTTTDGENYRIILRQSRYNILDFSAILLYVTPKTNGQFRLKRYNGKSHTHSNKLERTRFYDFHIHVASERYQAAGWSEDGYAEATNRYSTLREALFCLLEDCNIQWHGFDQLQIEGFQL